MASSGHYQFQSRIKHSNVLINDKLYSWGGNGTNMPKVHESEKKRKLTSAVEVFDFSSLSWSSVPTMGIPPAAVRFYSCSSINNTVYFFGGNCKPNDCYHNNVFALSTTSNEWNEVLTTDTGTTPMKKIGHGMISFSSEAEQYLLTIGGAGPTPTTTPSNSLYIPVPSSSDLTYTDETHILCLSSSPAQWTVPVVGGTPPPSVCFTLNTLPDDNRAVLFGGSVIDDTLHNTNDTYIVSYSKDQVSYNKLKCSSVNSPEARTRHSSTILTVNGNHYLLAVGGRSIHHDESGRGYYHTTSDCWILHVERRTWMKIDVPDAVSMRFDHSISSFPVSDNCFWIIVSGGSTQRNIKDKTVTPVAGPNVMVIVELVYSNDNWTVTNVWNSEQLVTNKTGIQSVLIRHLYCAKNMIHKEMISSGEEIKKLNSDVMVLNSRMEGYLMQLLEKERELEIQKKMFLALSVEKEDLAREKGTAREREKGHVEPNTEQQQEQEGEETRKYDKLAVLREEIEMLQNKVIMQSKELAQLSQKLRELDKPTELRDQTTQFNSIVPVTDVMVLNSKVEEYLTQLQEKDGKLEIQKKIISCLTQENEHLIKERKREKEVPKVPRVDVGIQFSYASRETDHLQGVTISGSKLFIVHGDQPQSLIWEGHGFELHLPEDTCLLNEDCEIMVDAVMGGQFVFSKGVEPVSTIYIISVTSKLRKPSLLKIQHCVALDKASKHSRLNFYRASLKEPNPPYHFRCLKGGRFDIQNQFGELELPAFCSIAIGKESTSSDESSDDTQSVEDTDVSSSSGVMDMEQERQAVPSNRGSSQSERNTSVDSSIIFYGQAFYLQKQLNQWQFKFIVVKNLDAFTQYVRSTLQNHEADVQISLRFSTGHIELVLDEEDAAIKFKGWSIKPHSDPLSLPLKHAASFGYEKQVSVPPTCLMTIYGDKYVPDYTERLHYPVPLRGALIGDDDHNATIYIIRTMAKEEQCRSSVQVQQNPTAVNTYQDADSPAVDISKVVTCIKEVIDMKFAALKAIFENSLERVSAEMFAAGLVSDEVKKKPTTQAILSDFYSCFTFIDTLPQVVQNCQKFFCVFHELGGPFTFAGNSLKQNITEKINNKLHLDLSFD